MRRRAETRDKTLARSNMADGSSEHRIGPKQMDELTFSAPDTEHGDSKKCSEGTSEGGRVNLSFYVELETSESSEKSDSRGVAADGPAVETTKSRKSVGATTADGEDRKKRCFDRYDSSESSDSGVVVLSPTESGACSGSDITEPSSPESGCSTGSGEGSGEESLGATRMPPWASEPAPPAPPARRLAAQPAPARRHNPPASHRRITEFFNHKMKPQNGLKRDCSALANDDIKRKCLPKNGVTNELQKYISYLSQTLNPRVLFDIGKQADAATRKNIPPANTAADNTNAAHLSNITSCTNINGMIDYAKPKDNKEKVHLNGSRNGVIDCKKQNFELKIPDPSANGIHNTNKQITTNLSQRKVTKPPSNEFSFKIAADDAKSPRKSNFTTSDSTKINGVVSSTTKLDSRMNGVTCGSNNLSLNIHYQSTVRKETPRKTTASKRTNRKSSACIANSKNLTWSKANNLKQVQLQKQNCVNVTPSPINSVPGEASTAPNMNIPNGIRQVSMTANGSLGNLSVPVTNLQNCHQINIPQACNGTVTSTNLGSFVAVPQNVMLTTLRIPQNGISAQTMNQQSNMNAYSRQNVNVSSPTKLNGQFVFPLMQNINGAVVQIPNLMAKMPNFVLPQTTQMAAQRQDHLQNQQGAQILINGTLLKLANTMTSTYPSINKPVVATSQSIPIMNKNVAAMPAVGMTVQSKPNYTVNFSHPVLVPQPGYIVTSVPNINVKETWSYTNTNTASQTTCSNPIIHHPQPMVNNYTAQALHTSSIPIAPVKPPDKPIQGTDPPSSTVKEPEISEVKSPKCDIPWLSKNVNNNIVSLDSKMPTRPFANVNCFSNKFDEVKEKVVEKIKCEDFKDEIRKDNTLEEIRKIEEIARREETIFTQITVLKDVSSNVQSTVIEADFCSGTTESSESGIGTDKSLDSPIDTRTIKECDEDLSLSVNVCLVEEQSCQKSPILKQPKILRFPPRSPVKSNGDQRTSKTDATSTVTCLWENCKKELESDPDLLEHLQSVHVETQAGKENYVCLWERCKVRGKPSCSRLWLARHALSHGGNKPFKCIVDSCERRFSTQILLERHVNNHFNEVSPNASGGRKATDSATKLIRRNGKKLRYRRQPWSARMFDFFDPGMMEGLAFRLARCTRWRLGGACPLREPAAGHALTLHAALAATRYNAAEGRREALLTYYPPHVIEDEWVPEKDVKRIKRVEIADLPVQTKVLLYEQFCASYKKNPPPSPVRKTPPAAPAPSRLLPARHCTSSRLLNNLIAKQRRDRSDCSATNVPMIFGEEDKSERAEVSGAKKRKLGRRHGGNAFWPCGR